eukprot:gene11252-23538_t
MRIFAILAHIFVAVVFAEIEYEDGVMVLYDDSFDEAIRTHETILIDFYAPWCGHCQSLTPEYAEAASILDKRGSPIRLAKFDASESTEIKDKYGIDGFPTIILFRSGSPMTYAGEQSASGIVRWLEKRTGPSTISISTVEELEKMKAEHNVFALGAFLDMEAQSAKTFSAKAAGDDSITYASTSSESIMNELGISQDTILILKNFDDKRADLVLSSAELNIPELESFIIENSIPLIIEFNEENANKVFGISPIK